MVPRFVTVLGPTPVRCLETTDGGRDHGQEGGEGTYDVPRFVSVLGPALARDPETTDGGRDHGQEVGEGTYDVRSDSLRRKWTGDSSSLELSVVHGFRLSPRFRSTNGERQTPENL